LSLPLGM